MPPDIIHAEHRLEVRNIWKYFGDFAALRGVSVRVDTGECLLLCGPNGAGKTTLLRTFALLAQPAEGEILLDSRTLSSSAMDVKLRLGFVSHATFLYNDLTVEENLRLAGKLFGLRNLKSRIETMLGVFVLSDRARQKVGSLSRGLQQRVTLARALLHDPDFLLLDEPFTGLDIDSATTLKMLLRQLPEEGKAVIFSTHHHAEGASIARRLVALDQGCVSYDGPLTEAPPRVLQVEQDAAIPVQ
ncbi:MAG: ABC transporter ATP-binding protein [Terriglobia bacterium]